MGTLSNLTGKTKQFFYGAKTFNCPQYLRVNHRTLSAEGEQRILDALKKDYFTYSVYFPDPVNVYLATEHGQADLKDHLLHRLARNRKKVIPWISSVMQLTGKRILEIGCGTGSSTVAFVEQRAEVLACDVHEGSLRVAKARLEAYQLEAEFVCANATTIFQQISNRTFDVIVLFAVLEHMTVEERLETLKNAWTLLPSGGYLVIHETPNRLWYFDDHTAFDHFFMWLPDELAIRYAKWTPRARYNKLFTNVDYSDANIKLDFTRWGRGVSYHDLVLAFDLCPAELPVESCLELFLREKTGTTQLNRNAIERQYEELFHSMCPDVHRGFFLKYLDLILRKP